MVQLYLYVLMYRGQGQNDQKTWMCIYVTSAVQVLVRHSLLRGQRRFGALEVPDVQMLDRRRPHPHRCHPTGRTRCSPLAPPQLWASSSVLTQTTRGLYAHVESRQRDDQKALQLRLVLLPAIVPAIVVFSAILYAIVFIQLLQLLVIKPQLSGQLKEHGAEDEEDLY